jgi:hypothetical protein
MARQTIKIDSGGDDLDFIADIIGDVGDLLLDTKTEKLYDIEGWGTRKAEIERDFNNITNIVQSFQYMDTQERDDALKVLEGLQEKEVAYQVRNEAKYALIKLNKLDDEYDKNESMVLEINALNEMIRKHRGTSDYQGTEYDSIIESIQKQTRDNTGTYTDGTIEYLEKSLEEKYAMDNVVNFLDDWTDVLENRDAAIDEVVYSIDKKELKKKGLVDGAGVIKLDGAREYVEKNYSHLIRDWEGFQTIPEIPESYREGIESIFDLWESGNITAKGLHEMITKKETDIYGKEIQGSALYRGDPYAFATRKIYEKIIMNDAKASEKLDTAAKLFNEVLRVTEAGTMGSALIMEGVTKLPLLNTKEAPDWHIYYTNLVQQMYKTLQFWAFQGPNDQIAEFLPDAHTPSKQIEGLRSVLEVLESPEYENVDLYYGGGMGDERKQWAIRILKVMLDPGGLESSRSEKTALYGDISRLDSKAAGEASGTSNLSEDQRRDLAEWQRTWGAEEYPITEFAFPTSDGSGPIVGAASTLTQFLGGPMDLINLMIGMEPEDLFFSSEYLWKKGLPLPYRPVLSDEGGTFGAGLETIPLKDIAEWIDWMFAGGSGGHHVRDKWTGLIVRRSGEDLPPPRFPRPLTPMRDHMGINIASPIIPRK